MARVHNGKDTQTVPILGLNIKANKVGFYEINLVEQQIVQDIFEAFVRLRSLKLLEEYCAEKGYPTKVRTIKHKVDEEGNITPPRQVGGESFDSVSLARHLSNPKYLGYGHFKDTWNQFPDKQDANGLVRWNYAHGPVITEELFFQAQAILHQNKERYSRPKARSTTFCNS